MEFQDELNETINYLGSVQAKEALEQDPYWPKWDTPWWRIMTLYEMDLVHLVPESMINILVSRMNSNYMKSFPFFENEIPEGVDPYLQIPCHCALGTIYQALSAYGIDVDSQLSWIRPWFPRYQLPDGGLNCDEQAYISSRKSSIVSTLPALEAILYHCDGGLSEKEQEFVDRGAAYLIRHRLCYRSSSEECMDKDFFKLSSPRFYEYDFLRGLVFLVRWKAARESSAADEVIEHGRSLLSQKIINGQLLKERISFHEGETLTQVGSGQWDWKPAKLFPLLEKVGEVGKPSKRLKKEFDEVMG